MHLWNRLVVMTAMLSLACSNKCSAGNTYAVDVNNAAAWSIGSGAGADSSVFFGFDYSSLGIPQAPGSMTTTAALMWSNTDSAAAAPQGITISPTGLSLTGDFIIRARIWLNSQAFNGTPPGVNSTQMFGFGVGYTGGTLWRTATTGGGSGVWFASSNDGDVGHLNTYISDYAAFIGSGELSNSLVIENEAYYAATSSGSLWPVRDNLHPYYQGKFPNGTPRMSWREYKIERTGTTITWSISGTPIASLSGADLTLDGATSVTYFDPFISIADPITSTFALVSSYEVELVPEPSTYAMALAGLACGGYSMWRRRKRVSSYRLLMLAAIVTVTVATAATPVFAQSVNYELVPVGDGGNANDPATGNLYGGVAYDYQIGKYDVTIGQYADFLNAVAKTDTYSLYNASMGTNENIRGISRSGTSGAYTYSVITPSGTTPAGASSPGNRPITYVSWWDSARFSNWMANGQPTGVQANVTTENGAYNVNGATSGTAPAKNVTNPNTSAPPTFFIPNENEWYKAAYYSPVLNSGSGGYYTYATQSNTTPGNVIGSGANQANYNNGVYSVTQSASYSSSQNYLTDVGAFTNSASFYGTFDQSGNVLQWNDLNGTPGAIRGVRGGGWAAFAPAGFLSSSYSYPFDTFIDAGSIGFRLAAAAAVPEPSTCFSLAAGLVFGGWHVLKVRRRRAVSGISLSLLVLLLATCSVMSGTAHAQPAIDWVTVGDPGNAADDTTYGAVADAFQIMKYEFTNQQYTAFLNSVARTDTYSLYNANMGSDARGGITRSGTSGSYTYATRTNMGDKPVNYVSWFDAARVSNWLMNGGTSSSSTETGAYTLIGGQTSGTAPAVNSGATFYVPTEDQWYKAAYYKGGSTSAGYWDYATQSDLSPTPVAADSIGIGLAGAAGDFANYNRGADWNGQDGNVTAVGTNGSPSFYGSFDMSGNVYEWNDRTGAANSFRGLRGGRWLSALASYMSSTYRDGAEASYEYDGGGFRLAAPVPEPSTYAMALAGLACGGYSMWRRRKRDGSGITWIVAFALALAGGTTPTLAQSVNYELVPVGDPGNAPDTTGYGAASYEYQIGKYDVTIGQYTDFLNAVAATDTYSLYNGSMATDLNVAGIAQSGSSGSYTYSVIAPSGTTPAGASSPGNRPITYVSWWDSARFSNWMANGQPSGAQSSTTTENGAYNVNGATSGTAPARNVTNPNTSAPPTFFIPNENEWYKAAYYSPVLNSGSGGYYTYATQSNTAPGNTIGNGANQANYAPGGVYAVTQSSSGDSNQNFLTDVGAFSGSGSFYGTFDQSGNVFQWNDLDGLASSGSSHVVRGGDIGSSAFDLSSSNSLSFASSFEFVTIGFRLASPVAVPEPSTYAMALAGIACGGYSMWRRRKRVSSYRLLLLAAIVTVTVATAAMPVFAQSVNYELVPVGDAGNANDTSSYGGVNYSYQIGKYDVTIGQYTDFLNAVAATDTYSLYEASMATDPNVAGIARTGVSGSYNYSVIGPSGTTPAGASSPRNRPITVVSWFDSARFANWMANGQPTGAQNSTTTENGAYALSGTTTAPSKNVTNPNTSAPPTFFIPNENEWYKAAYYSPVLNSGSGGYYTYATRSNAAPGNIVGSGANQANYKSGGVYSVTQLGAYDPSQNYLTDVGAFSGSASFYGTFDQSGNVFQWNDLDGTSGSSRGLRGGYWNVGDTFSLSSSSRYTVGPSYRNGTGGFRLASPVAVPEPSTYAMALAGLVCGGYSMFRRRAR